MTDHGTALIALTVYAMWTMFLVISVTLVRMHKSLTAGIEDAGASLRDVDSFWRMHRAHMNAIENLPIFAAVVLTGFAAGAVDHGFAQLALLVVVARAVQSLAHIWSGGQVAVSIRFIAFLTQILGQFWMCWLILLSTGVLLPKA